MFAILFLFANQIRNSVSGDFLCQLQGFPNLPPVRIFPALGTSCGAHTPGTGCMIFSRLGDKLGYFSRSYDLVLFSRVWYRQLTIYWTRLIKISSDLSVTSRRIICLSLRLQQIIDLRDTDKSRYSAITLFNNCFIIRSPSLFLYFNHFLAAQESDLPFFTQERGYARAEHYLRQNTFRRYHA